MNTHIENIIADIKRGNKQAFKKLFDDYYPILCVFSFHYVEDKEVCKDIVQDALLAYWERKEDFNDILKVKSFLYTVTRNKCLNYLKHAQLDIPFFHGKEEYQMRNIILYSMKGLKNNEIADKLQISEGTVHKLKKIAYRKLRESLKGINYILCLFLCK